MSISTRLYLFKSAISSPLLTHPIFVDVHQKPIVLRRAILIRLRQFNIRPALLAQCQDAQLLLQRQLDDSNFRYITCDRKFPCPASKLANCAHHGARPLVSTLILPDLIISTILDKQISRPQSLLMIKCIKSARRLENEIREGRVGPHINCKSLVPTHSLRPRLLHGMVTAAPAPGLARPAPPREPALVGGLAPHSTLPPHIERTPNPCTTFILNPHTPNPAPKLN
ncbi:hypothetical protein M758_10G007300 [Ceratodon purpureus]|nr:hypothetical protein M758_10G007300 [Ceratodon purpureus]